MATRVLTRTATAEHAETTPMVRSTVRTGRSNISKVPYLPGLDGLAVARRIRASGQHAPCLVAVTGFGLEQDRIATREAGFAAHLTKPVSPEELARVISAVPAQAAGSALA